MEEGTFCWGIIGGAVALLLFVLWLQGKHTEYTPRQGNQDGYTARKSPHGVGEEAPSEPLSSEERLERTQEIIRRYRDNGFQVKPTGDYKFQALKPKEFSGCAFLLLLLLGVFPGLFYLLWHGLVADDRREVVQIDEYGEVHWQKVAEFGFE